MTVARPWGCLGALQHIRRYDVKQAVIFKRYIVTLEGRFNTSGGMMSNRTKKLTQALITFNEAGLDVTAIAMDIGGDEGRILEHWLVWTGQALSALHAVAIRADQGQPIIVECASCGETLSMFDVWRDETLCPGCRQESPPPTRRALSA